jgi:hypothetical protein
MITNTVNYNISREKIGNFSGKFQALFQKRDIFAPLVQNHRRFVVVLLLSLALVLSRMAQLAFRL